LLKAVPLAALLSLTTKVRTKGALLVARSKSL
jgi:hypothetical protein